MSKLILPTWIKDYPQIPAAYQSGKLTKSPIGIVIHSGETHPGVAEYFQTDGALKRKVSAHFAWSDKRCGFVQCVPLDHRACHVGFWYNRSHIGIELPGPYDQKRSDAQYIELKKLIYVIRGYIGTIEELVAHSFIDKKKKDPGPYFEWERLINLGFRCKF